MKLLPTGNRGNARVLLVLPCNSCVRIGDYSMCENWRIVLRDLYWFVELGLLDLAAIDSCKPGIVLWGMESGLRWCDLHPSYDLYYNRERWRFHILFNSVLNDIRNLLKKYKYIVYYVNVKAYREVLRNTATKYPEHLIEAGPEHLSPLSYRSRRARTKLLSIINSLLHY